MTCKCGARTYEAHIQKVEKGRYPAHTYKGLLPWGSAK